MSLDHLWLLAFDRPNAELRVVLQYFVPMKVVERFRCILTCDLLQHNGATRMRIDEVGNIVDLVIHNEPQIILRVVLGLC